MSSNLKNYAILILIMALPVIGIDLYLPTMPTLVQAFNSTASYIQATLSAFFAGFAIAQLIYAPLGKRFGAKKVLLAGLALYLIGSILCALATSANSILIFRFVSGVGACAASVMGRTLIRAIFQENASKAFSIIFPWIGSSPAFSPAIGGLILRETGHWQWVFICLAIAIALAIVALVLFLKAHHEKQSTPQAAGGYAALFKNSAYIANIVVYVGQFVVWSIYITLAPFVFHQNHFNPWEIGLAFLPVAACFFIGGNLNSYLLHYCSEKKLFRAGLLMMTLGSLLMLGGIWFESWMWLTFPMMVVAGGLGSVAPLAASGCLKAADDNVIHASSMMGFLQFAVAAIVIATITHYLPSSTLMVGIGILITTLLMWLSYRLKLSEFYACQ